MNTIDIRDDKKEFPVQRIVFADADGWGGNKLGFLQMDDGDLYIGNDDDEYEISTDKETLSNLLKALLKAQELGWLPKPVVEAPKTPVKRAVAAKKATK